MPTAIKAHQGSVHSIAATPNGNTAVSKGPDGLLVWDVSSHQIVNKMASNEMDVTTAVAITANGRWIAVAGRDRGKRQIGLWDSNGDNITWQDFGDADVVINGMVITPDGRYAITISYGTPPAVWDLVEGTKVCEYLGHRDSVMSIVLMADGNHVATSAYDKTVQVWNWRTAKTKHVLIGHDSHYVILDSAARTSRLVSVGSDYQICEWDTQTGQLVQTLSMVVPFAKAIAVSPDGRLALTAGGNLQLWDLQAKERISLRLLGSRVYSCAVAKNDVFITGDNLGRIAFSTVDELRETKTLFNPAWPALSKASAQDPAIRSEIIKHIESRYQFRLPDEYRQACYQGFCDSFDADGDDDRYAWLPDAEWTSLLEILDYQFDADQISDLVPFASHDNGDWFWWPPKTGEYGTPIVQCFRAEPSIYYAPNFAGFLYRQVLEYAAGKAWPENADECRAQIRKWQAAFAAYWPLAWQQTIENIVVKNHVSEGQEFRGLIEWDECSAIVDRDLSFPELNEEFDWYA